MDKLVSKFIEFEENNSLFKKEIKGYKFWSYVRFNVFATFYINDFQDQRSTLKYGLIPKYFFCFLNSIYNFFKFYNKKYDFIFINTSGRTNLIEKKQVDIYSYPVIKQLNNKYKILLIDINAFTKSNDYPCNFLPMRFISPLYKFLFFFVIWSAKEKDYLNNVNIRIKNLFNTNIDFFKIINSSLKKQIIDNKIYTIVFKHFSPLAIFYTNNGLINGIIKAANELRINTIELQHGTISHLHTAYNSENFNDSVVPKYFFTFGTYWHEAIKMRCQKIAVGFPYMDIIQEDISKDIIRNDQAIVVISDCKLSRKIFVKITLEIVDALPDCRIYYKLRPEEYKDWKHLYPDSFQTNPSIKVIDNNDKPLYEYYRQAKYLIGPSSTAIYEGIAHEMIVFLVKSNFYLDLKRLIEGNTLFVVSDAQEIITKIKSGIVPKGRINKEDIFKSNSLQNIEEAIAEVLRKKC